MTAFLLPFCSVYLENRMAVCMGYPAMILKRRAGKHGTYNPKHNDRNFDLTNSEHIDPERAKGNIYWDCFHGFRSTIAPQDPDDLAGTFSDVERQFYETHYSEFIERQNERNAKIRHTERNRSIPDLLSSRKTCPEETSYQLGTKDDHASGEVLLAVVTEFIEEFKARFGDHVHVIEDTKRWVLSPERKAPQATREYTAKHLDGVLNKFLKTMQTASARLQEALLKPEVRQKGKEQVKEKARDSVLQLLNRLQAEQMHKPTAQPRTKGEYSEI